MSARPTFPSADAEPPPEPADADPWGRDGVAARDARRQRRLDELADLGMGLARRVARAGEDADDPPPAELASLSMAFGRISRTVRLTEALADRLDHPPAAPALAGGQRLLDGAIVMDAQSMLAARTSVRGKFAKLIVRDNVAEAIEAEARERGDGIDVEALLDALDRRIGGPETIEAFGATPIGEMVARICAELGVPYDGDDGLWEADEAEAHGPAPPSH